jgi:hypothetical protein
MSDTQVTPERTEKSVEELAETFGRLIESSVEKPAAVVEHFTLMLKLEQEERESLQSQLTAARTEIDALKAALLWSLDTIEEDSCTDEAGTPDHLCGFYDNPESGHCSFHEKYWGARALLESTPPEAK